MNVSKSPLLSFFLYISITYRSICNKTIINQKNNTVYSSDVYLQTCSYRLSPPGGAKPEERSINKGISQHRLMEGTSECLHESRRAGGPVFGQQKRRLLRNWLGWDSVLGHHDVLVTPHLLQHGRQTVQIAVGEVLRLPKVQDHPRRTRLGGEVVEIPAERQIGREAR